jgi:hypothetical protein
LSVAGSGGVLDDFLIAVLDAIVARLVPSDAIGPGAREAGVVPYIERALATEYAAHRPAYADGLSAVDRYAASIHGQGFATLPPDLQDKVVTDLEHGRVPGFTPSSSDFFELVLRHTLEGMFGDPKWGGNVELAGWGLIGYAGPRLVWTEEEQRLEEAQ